MTTNKKRRIGRKVFAILLTLCLVFSTTCTSVFATELTETPVAGDAVAQTESDSQPEATEETGSTPNTVPEATQPSNGETVNAPTSVNAGTDSSSKADVPKAAQAKASVKKEMPAVVKNFLNAVNKLAALGEITEENAEEFNALGQAAMDAYEAVQDAGLEDYEGVEDALMVLMGIADSVTGGAETMDLVNGNATVHLHYSTGTSPTGVKVKIGDYVSGYPVTKISGYDIWVEVCKGQWANNISFNVPNPETIWYGVKRSYGSNATYTSVTGNSSGNRWTMLCSESGGSVYYYNVGSDPSNTPSGGGSGDESKLWNFTLKYDANGGTGAPADQTYGTNDKYTKSHRFTVSNATPTRPGYTFKGWLTPDSKTVDSGGYYDMYQTVSGYNGGSVTATLYAVWEENVEKVTLTYKDRGSVYATETVDKGSNITVKDCTNQKKDYEFIGWSADSNATEAEYEVGDRFTLNENLILFAVWKSKDNGNGISVTKERVSIDNDTNKIIAEPGEEIMWEITVTNNSTVTKTVTLKETLQGAYFTATNQNTQMISVDAHDSQTVYAKYTVKNPDKGTTITNTVIASTGGTGDKENPKATDDGTEVPDKDKKVTARWMDGYTDTPIKEETVAKDISDEDLQELYPADQTREGFKFKGWEKPVRGADGNITITAQWKQVVTITIEFVDENGDVVGKEEVTVDKGSEYDVTEAAGKIPDGYEANGGPTGDPTTGTADGSKTVTVPVKKQETQKVTITVNFVDEEGNIVGTKPVEVDKGSEYDVTDTIGQVPGGYEANGDPTGDPVTGTADGDKTITVSVKKQENPIYNYTLTYDANMPNGVTGTVTGMPDPQQSGDIEAETWETTVSGVEPTLEGYTFLGWSIDPAATVADAGWSAGRTVTLSENTTLYAVWQVEDEPVVPTPTPTPDPTTPVGPTPITPVGPAATPTAATPALAAAPAAAPAAALVPVADAAVPLANVDADDTRQVNDEDVPLAKGAENEWALLNLLLMIFTILVSVMLLIFYFIGRKEDKDDEYNERLQAASEDETEGRLKRKGLFRLLSIIPAVVAVIFFILTEDMRNPMVFTDKWTLWMAVFALVNVVLAVFAKKKHYDNDDTQKPDYGIA